MIYISINYNNMLMNVFNFLKNIFIELYLLKIRMKNLGQSQKRGHNSASISNTL